MSNGIFLVYNGNVNDISGINCAWPRDYWDSNSDGFADRRIGARQVEVHGRRIWVESQGEDKGSMFCFTLPVKE